MYYSIFWSKYLSALHIYFFHCSVLEYSWKIKVVTLASASTMKMGKVKMAKEIQYWVCEQENLINKVRVFFVWFDDPYHIERRFTDGSTGKESTCNAGDPVSIPGSGRSAGEGIGYPLQCSWASLVAHMLKNPPVMRETWVQFLVRKEKAKGTHSLLEKAKGTHSNILA